MKGSTIKIDFSKEMLSDAYYKWLKDKFDFWKAEHLSSDSINLTNGQERDEQLLTAKTQRRLL